MEQISEGRGLEDEEEDDFFPFCILKKKNLLCTQVLLLCSGSVQGALHQCYVSQKGFEEVSPPFSSYLWDAGGGEPAFDTTEEAESQAIKNVPCPL